MSKEIFVNPFISTPPPYFSHFLSLHLHILAADQSVILTHDTDSFIIGQRVWVGGIRPGHIQYIGDTHFAPGEWAGVVLDEPNGKNDGCVSGKRYFQCEPKRGIFSRLTRLTREPLSGDDTFSRSMTTSPNRSGTVSPVPSSYSTYQNQMMASTPRKSSSSKYHLSVHICQLISRSCASLLPAKWEPYTPELIY